MTAAPLGDTAVLIPVGAGLDPAVVSRVAAVAAALRECGLPGLAEVVPAFGSVTVHLDPAVRAPDAELRAELTSVARGARAGADGCAPREVELPVRYGGEGGPDLAAVAEHAGLSPEAVIAVHSGATYSVQAIGFVPGFPYLGGLPPALHMPRRSTPRSLVSAGSVGIGGAQTGVYPLPTPGGWNLIGRTPLRLFDPARPEPALLRMGDRLRFRAVGPGEVAGGDEEAPGVPAGPTAGQVGVGLRVLRGGPFTTVQDLGRPGRRAEGVPVSGAADSLALRVANLLVGNVEGAAALEFTQVGPEIEFTSDVVVALAGARSDAVPSGRPLAFAAGSRLNLGRLRDGGRGYLAIAGGIEVPLVLGSRSTYVRAALGGWQGRCLREGDGLPLGRAERRLREGWQADLRFLARKGPTTELRVLPAAQADEFPGDWSSREFTVAAQSDRMGVRLRGQPLVRGNGAELASSPVVPGTVQVPPDGHPIILLADAQTIGGYPQLATVILADLPRLAQLEPGDQVRLTEVDLPAARRLWMEQERSLAVLSEGLRGRWS